MLRSHRPAGLLMWLVLGCALPPTGELVYEGELLGELRSEDRDSSGRCHYDLEGAIAFAAATTVLRIVEDRPMEDLAYMIPISAGAGWLWGRFIMPQRARCRSSLTPPVGRGQAGTTAPLQPD